MKINMRELVGTLMPLIPRAIPNFLKGAGRHEMALQRAHYAVTAYGTRG